VKKGRHRRFEEARALKRSTDFDADRLFESLQKERGGDDGRVGSEDDTDEDEFLDEDDD
jgi:hypothetical protein